MLLRLLCARRYGASVKDMDRETGMSEKTIRRDLQVFQHSGLPDHRGSLYLVGFTGTDHREIRRWKVDRMENTELTRVHFHLQEDFNLREHLAGSFGVFRGDRTGAVAKGDD